MRVPRFKLRTLLAIVLLAGLLLGGRAMWIRRADFEQRAMSYHALSLLEREGRRQNQTRAEYYEKLSVKYEYAARHPWLLVEPDPPEPPFDRRESTTMFVD